MNASSVLTSLSEKGYRLKIDGEGVRCHPKPSNEVRELIKANKAEIITLLRSGNPDPPPPIPLPENSPTSPLSENSRELFLTAGSVAEMLPPNDPDRLTLHRLIDQARRSDPTKDDLDRLAFALVSVYGRRINSEYRAAIWGGRKWSEVKAERKTP